MRLAAKYFGFLTVSLTLCTAPAVAQEAPASGKEAPAASALDDRPVFNPVVLKKRGYQVMPAEDVVDFGDSLVAVMTAQVLPEAEGTNSGLEQISRLFILSGDRIVFDSFEMDDVGEFVEPSINSRTFFQLTWSVVKVTKGKSYLVLRGITPRQKSGEPIRTAKRVVVLTQKGPASFEVLVDSAGTTDPVVTATEVRIPIK